MREFEGTYGVVSGESVGVRMMIGVHLLGGVGGLLSRMTGEVSLRENLPSFLLSNEAVDRDRSLWYGCDDPW